MMPNFTEGTTHLARLPTFASRCLGPHVCASVGPDSGFFGGQQSCLTLKLQRAVPVMAEIDTQHKESG